MNVHAPSIPPRPPSPKGCSDRVPVAANERRILILAPTRNDAQLTSAFLAQSGMDAKTCKEMPELCDEIGSGCGCIFIAEEALGNESIHLLAATLSKQASWSDVPIAVISSADPRRTRFEKLEALDPGGNVTILERPFRPETLIRNAEVALRARERQYQVRDLLAESRKREDRLRASEERFRKMSDSAPVMIWLSSLDGNRYWFNKAWLNFTGRSIDDNAGNQWPTNIHPEDQEACLRRYKTRFASRREFQIEYRFQRHDGAWRWLLDHGTPLHGADDELTGYIGSCVDITERKETMAELEKIVGERTATLRETIGDLEAFSYTVSHDLRAPLRAVQSYAQILKNEYQNAVLDETGVDYLNRIVKAGNRLDGLIQDVLAYSRVARRDYPMHPVELAPLISDIVRQYPQLQKPTVKVDVCEPLPLVRGSEALLTQCISNLLGNAAKFVPLGQQAEIIVHCEQGDGSKVRLWIEDNGLGIPPEHHNRIFGMFERLNQKDYDGTGVGLAIVRKAVERMGGRIGLISQPGSGSKFWIELERG